MKRTLLDLTDDDPITLSEASKVVLKGAVTVSTLRAEVRRGNLEVERIGKNLFTTKGYIKAMRDRCRVTPQAAAPLSQADRSVVDKVSELKRVAKALIDSSKRRSRASPDG